MRIGICSRRDPFTKNSWSGLEYFMLESLKKYNYEVVALGPLSTKLIFFGKVINKLSKIFLGKKFEYIHSPIIAKRYAKMIAAKIEKGRFDILFFPGACEVLAYFDIYHTPIIYFSDSTVKLMADYYEGFSNLLPMSYKWANDIEQRAINKADLLLYPSRWAAESAVKDYNCPPDKIQIIHCGGNITTVPNREKVLAAKKKTSAILKLLFIGSDWDRKGGDIAFESMLELNKRGVNTHLIVCGRCPDAIQRHDKIDFVGFLDQNIPQELLKFQKLYLDSSILIVPSRSECFGFVFAESSAYGLPIMTTDTGGIPDYVEHNKNGFLLPLEANAKMYADKIEILWKNKEMYARFSINSRDKFEKELNWDAWGRLVSKTLTNFIK